MLRIPSSEVAMAAMTWMAYENHIFIRVCIGIRQVLTSHT